MRVLYARYANVLQAEMAGSPDLAPILEMLNATRASARERQGEIERKIRAEARKLRQGDAAGASDRDSLQHVPMSSDQ